MLVEELMHLGKCSCHPGEDAHDVSDMKAGTLGLTLKVFSPQKLCFGQNILPHIEKLLTAELCGEEGIKETDNPQKKTTKTIKKRKPSKRRNTKMPRSHEKGVEATRSQESTGNNLNPNLNTSLKDSSSSPSTKKNRDGTTK